MHVRLSLLVVSSVVFSVPNALAEDVGPGAIVTTKGELPLRDAPPGGFLGLKGDAIGNVKPAVQFRVIEQKTYSTVLGGENWLKVQRVDDALQQGWVYSGTKENPAANVIIKPPQ